jgi:hypothetical protein
MAGEPATDDHEEEKSERAPRFAERHVPGAREDDGE